MPYRNILMIDDDEDDQEIFLTAVQEVSPSVNCICIDSGIDALNQLVSKAISPEVIFLDLNMPIMNGHQFLLEIKKQPSISEIPVIIFSTSAHSATIQLMKSLGALDFITKPTGYTQLIDILKPLVR